MPQRRVEGTPDLSEHVGTLAKVGREYGEVDFPKEVEGYLRWRWPLSMIVAAS